MEKQFLGLTLKKKKIPSVYFQIIFIFYTFTVRIKIIFNQYLFNIIMKNLFAFL